MSRLSARDESRRGQNRQAASHRSKAPTDKFERDADKKKLASTFRKAVDNLATRRRPGETSRRPPQSGRRARKGTVVAAKPAPTFGKPPSSFRTSPRQFRSRRRRSERRSRIRKRRRRPFRSQRIQREGDVDHLERDAMKGKGVPTIENVVLTICNATHCVEKLTAKSARRLRLDESRRRPSKADGFY